MTRTDSELARDCCWSLSRLAHDYESVGVAINTKATSRGLRDLTNPPSTKGGLRKLGIALAVAPEPATTLVGVGLVAASFAMTKSEPATLQTLGEAAAKCFSELEVSSRNGLSISI